MWEIANKSGWWTKSDFLELVFEETEWKYEKFQTHLQVR